MLRPAHRFLLALLGLVAAVLLSGCQTTTSATPSTLSTGTTVTSTTSLATTSTTVPVTTTTAASTTTTTLAPTKAHAPVVTTKAKPKVVHTTTRKPVSKAACGSGYYRNSSGVCVHRPVAGGSAPVGASAKCKDGTYSFSKHRRGTCSGHGGVAQWL